MTIDKACPDQEVLEELLLGRVQAEDAVELEVHFVDCEKCAHRASEIIRGDELVVAMQAKRLPPEDDGRISELIQRLRQVSAEAETSRPRDTQAGADNRSEAALAELSALLDPAEGPGEIGRIGQYRVLDVLGVGGMGLVLRAEDPNLRRPVAIKVMKGGIAADESTKSRFLREAQATAAIEHDHIVTIYQVAEHRKLPYYAMQFLRGESLEDRLKREGNLDQSEVLRIGREIAMGLAAAHAAGLLHRDIKPDNIWLEEKTGRAKIVDFGLARDVKEEENITLSGMVIGTPRYMAPEQALGKTVDHRCDLFSLGTVMYQLATGHPPFVAENLASTLMAVANKQPLPIREVQPGLAPDVARIIDRLLAKDPASRFQSALEVIDVIQKTEQRLADEKPRKVRQDRSQPTGVPEILSTQRRTVATLFTVLVGALLAIAFATTFLIKTPTGTVRVEVNNADLEVLIDGKTITLRDKVWVGQKKASKHTLVIKVGERTLSTESPTVFKVDGGDVEHHLSVQFNGVDLSSNEFTAVRDGENILSISYEEYPIDSVETANYSAVELNENITADDDWVDLLAAVDLRRDTTGSWRKDAGEFLGSGSFIFPVRPMGRFEWEIELTHAATSNGAIDILIPHPHGRVHARLTGESGLRLSHPANSKDESRILVAAPAASRGERHTLKLSCDIRADKTSVAIKLDGQPWAAWTGDSQTLLTRMPPVQHPYIHTGRHQITIRSTRLRILDGEAPTETWKMPQRLDDLAKGAWVPLFSSAEDLKLTGATTDRATWKDGVVDVVNTSKKKAGGSGVVKALSAPRGRNVILRAEIYRIEGHFASLSLHGSKEDVVTVCSTKTSGYVLQRRDLIFGRYSQSVSVPRSRKSMKGFKDVAIALIDGHAGLYLDGKLVLHRYGWNDTENREPSIRAYDIGYRPGHARFRNARVMVLDAAANSERKTPDSKVK